MSGGSHMMMMMQMTFTTDFPSEFLFAEWGTIDNNTDKILACVGTFLLSILYEVFKDLRAMWNNGFFSKEFDHSNNINPSTDDCCNDLSTNLSVYTSNYWSRLFLQSFLHIFQVFIAFVLMLIAMTYNYWLILSVCVGNGVGYLINGVVRKCIISSKMKNKTKTVKAKVSKATTIESTGESNSCYSADDYNNFDTNKNSTTVGYRYPERAYEPKVQKKSHHVYDNYDNSNNFNY